MSRSANHDRLAALANGMCDQTITAAEVAELDAILKADDVACEFYVDLLGLEAEIPWTIRAVEEGQELHDDLRLSAELGDSASDQPSAISDVPSPTPRSKKSWLDRASRRPVRPALAIAALVMISVVAWMGVTTVKTRLAESGKSTNELQEPTKPEFVAWLMKAHETQWLDGTEPKQTRLMPGQRLAISKGLIEIQYRTRAVVVIEGPAEFFVGSKGKSRNGKAESGTEDRSLGREPVVHEKESNSGYLQLGKLVARVEGKKAEGFTIDTPSGRVEDHGTEFGVEVDDAGASEFVVLSGKVDVIREDADGVLGERIRLTKDQGAVVRRGARRIVRVASTAKFAASFVASLPAASVGSDQTNAGTFSSIAWSNDSDLPLSGSLTYTHAIDFASGTPLNGQAATTIAGVSFTEEYVAAGDVTFNNTSTFSGTHIPTGNAWSLTYSNLVGGGAFGWPAVACCGPSGTASTTLSGGGATAHGASATATADYSLVLSGLTANTDYIFTFYSANFDNSRQVILDGADDGVGNTLTVQQNSSQIVRYAYNTGAGTTFTLNAASTASTFWAFTNEQLPTPIVPEPSVERTPQKEEPGSSHTETREEKTEGRITSPKARTNHGE